MECSLVLLVVSHDALTVVHACTTVMGRYCTGTVHYLSHRGVWYVALAEYIIPDPVGGQEMCTR